MYPTRCLLTIYYISEALPPKFTMRLQRLRRGAVQRLLRITAFVEWSTAISCELLVLCRHLLRGLVVCDAMTDRYPV